MFDFTFLSSYVRSNCAFLCGKLVCAIKYVHGAFDCVAFLSAQNEFTPFQPSNSGHFQVQILPPKNLGITEGSRAKWTCHITGEKVN
jgi:hypothetical protein